MLQKGPLPSYRDTLVLIPLVPQIVPVVQVSEKKVFIDPPAGLLDLTYFREERVRIKGFLPPCWDENERDLEMMKALSLAPESTSQSEVSHSSARVSSKLTSHYQRWKQSTRPFPKVSGICFPSSGY
jgi:hypothetical protein